MTQLNGKPLKRETAASYRGRFLVVEMYAGYLAIRPKGKRLRYAIDWRSVYEAAGKMEARKQRETKIESRRKR